MNNNRYEQRYIAYIDILGFKNLVKESEEDESIFDKIERMLLLLKDNDPSDNIYPKKYLFSDSIIITAEHSDRELRKLINKVHRICIYMLADRSLLTRGAIVRDKLYEDDRGIVFGTGLDRAYVMEKEIAIYPRILIDDVVYEDSKNILLSESESDRYKGCINEYFRKDFDSLYHLDILKLGYYFDVSDDQSWRNDIRHAIEDGLCKLRQNKEENSQTYVKNAWKYAWLVGYFNKYQEIWGDYLVSPIQTE